MEETRQNFMSEIKGLSSIEREVSININKTIYRILLLCQSLPHPVDPFIERFSLTMDFAEAVRF